MLKTPFTILLAASTFSTVFSQKFTKSDFQNFRIADSNAIVAHEAFERSIQCTYAWLAQADPKSGLIPENMQAGRDNWIIHNSAADNFPFLALASYILDKKLYNSKIKAILEQEIKLCSRLGKLPDSYSFSKGGFMREYIDTAQIIFGAAEYMKDGLVPLTEYTGYTHFTKRMIDLINELQKHMVIAQNIKGYFYGNSVDMEINGDLLQILCRLYWLTKNERYLKWAIRIGDYYLLDNRLLNAEKIRLRDHGSEIIGGLSELYLTVHFKNKALKEKYKPALNAFLDKILAVGINQHGMFYNEVNLKTGEIIDNNIADTWGYIYNAYYTLYLIDGKNEYRYAILKALSNLPNNYNNFNWENGSSDGYADAIEGAINFYQREPQLVQLKSWIDSEIKIMWNMQGKANKQNPSLGKGMIEGWHGDGNFIRTSIMYGLMNTSNATLPDWNSNVKLGATLSNGTLFVTISSDIAYQSKFCLSENKASSILNFPIDYPRINQFPNWFSVETNKVYILIDGKNIQKLKGKDLVKGYNFRINPNQKLYFKIYSQ